jgi:membrane protease YdiL (CAAX protease family)
MTEKRSTSGTETRVGAYLALAFALSWALWIPVMLWKDNPVFLNLSGGPALAAMWLAASRHRPRKNHARLLAFALIVPFCWIVVILDVGANAGPAVPLRFNPYLLLPSAISAWIVSGAFSHDSGVRSLMRTLVAPPNWRWCAIAVLALPAFMLITVVVGRASGLAVISPVPGVTGRPLASLLGVRFFHYLFFTAVFEEPGWRGFLLPRLQARFSPLVATVLVWLPWAVWHLPLDLTRPGGGWGLSMILQQRGLTLLIISILITWLYNRSRGALLSPVLFHGAMGSFPFVLSAAPALRPLIFVWAIIVVVADRMWHRRSSQLAQEGLAGASRSTSARVLGFGEFPK